MAALSRHWILGLMAAILLAATLATLNIAQQIGRPFGGFYTTLGIVWQVDAPTPSWWPAMSAGGLQYDDELVALDGSPYGPTSYQRFAQATALGRHDFTLTIRRGGALQQLILPIRTFTVGNFLDFKLPDLLMGLGFWLLAVAVYLARPKESVNRIFAIACSLTAGSVWLTIRPSPS